MNRKKLFLYTVLFGFSMSMHAFAQTASSQSAYAKGKKLFDEGNYSEAMSSFLKSVDADNSNVQANFMLAESYYNLKMSTKALEAFNKTYELLVKMDLKSGLSAELSTLRDNSGRRIMELDELAKDCQPAQKEYAKKLLKVLEKSRKANKTAFSIELCREILGLDPQCEDAKKAFKELTGKAYEGPSAAAPKPAGAAKNPDAKVVSKQLFNGTDITGWAGTAPDDWKVENSAITGKAVFNSINILSYRNEQFINRYKFSVKMKTESAVTKSGIVFGMRDDVAKFYTSSVNENGNFALMEISRDGKAKVVQEAVVETMKKQDWNEMTLIVSADSVEISINGTRVLKAPSTIDIECFLGVMVSNGTVSFSAVSIDPEE